MGPGLVSDTQRHRVLDTLGAGDGRLESFAHSLHSGQHSCREMLGNGLQNLSRTKDSATHVVICHLVLEFLLIADISVASLMLDLAA